MRPSKRGLWAIKLNLLWGIRYSVVEAYILFILFSLAIGLIDPRELTTLVVTDVGIGIVLYYLLGDRRRASLEEVSNLDEVAERFQHLVIHRRIKKFLSREFESSLYYVENTATGEAYRCPNYLRNVARLGAFRLSTHEKRGEMDADLSCRHINLNERDPTFLELRSAYKAKVEPSP